MKLTQVQIDRILALTVDGRITPDRILEDATAEDSPLHPEFEWDNDVAAHQHRLDQAREIIASVRYVITSRETIISTPVYVRDPDAGREQGYRDVRVLQRDKEAARAALVYTLNVGAGHLRRALELSVPLGLQDEVDTLLDQILGVVRRIEKAA